MLFNGEILMDHFFGRKDELDTLKSLLSKKSASLVTVTGRRRIGKSRLIEHFGNQSGQFISIQGLGPDLNITNQQQLDHFSDSLSEQIGLRQKNYKDWKEAFKDLAEKTKKGNFIILLDEISWMGKEEPLFPLLLKDAWDQHFKKNSKLILILCGSVSTWIEDNILKSRTFLGRVSLSLTVRGLYINEINQFWKKQKFHMSPFEKMMILSITGGVPKYLEEITNKPMASVNLARLCFSEGGLLFNEFENIFMDIFAKKSKTLEKIIRLCLDKKTSPTELAKKLKIDFNSEVSEHIHMLEISGFLTRDYYYKADGSQSKLSHLRVNDNYLRFYVKYIEPLKNKIKKAEKKVTSFTDLENFESLMGYQFENLILANRQKIIEKMQIKSNQIHSASPYVQRVTLKTKKACQIDLLIHTKMDLFFICEIKCKKMIDHSVIKEVEQKMKALQLPKRCSAKPVLIYCGELYPPHLSEIENYFQHIISFDELLEG
jgi:uncharacterized protein